MANVLRIPVADALPPAVRHRERMVYTVLGDDGEATEVFLCVKSDDDTYTWVSLTEATVQTVAPTFVIDGGGSAITTGIKGDLLVPFAGTITKWGIFADQTGSIVFDLWKDTFANYPPTVADSITGSAKPTLTNATMAQSSTLTGWTTAIAADDILRINVDSAATVTRVTFVLHLVRI